ncbi:ATP-binding protein [Paractinoplanes rishiriensis]|uniref:HTH cro/C1-type domain-containing protein n=1 Tax=Paractinoplanes rishiriensis TaxID=1050105 RepID=A0A919K5R8_9ACTN|nr:tetratricopeptide repeat protein [Actinoplanes rishiriensis]GIF01371.1 hypothetical protein Ari01nite_88350 [Actinoplanes rishiriensis]
MFGELVRTHRRRLGMTQEDLAEHAGVSVRSVGKWESGRIAAPRLFTVRLLADTFGLQGEERDRFCRSATDEQPETDIAPAQLPPDPAGFTGRDAEMDRLTRLLSADQPLGVLISAVSGTAGIGKTALAVHWAHRVRDRFPDGQLYVNLRGFDPAGTPVPPGEALRGLLDGLGVPPLRVPEPLATRAALYRSVLAGRRMLILLDNAADAEQVRPLLPGVPGCLVVVTSRDRLTGLTISDGAQPVLLDVLSPADARGLLARRIGTARVQAEPGATDQIVDACARLPLALAVIAARAAANPHFPLSAIAGELRAGDSRLDVLAGPDPVTDVRAVFSWSYRRLSPGAARLFRLLGLHPSPNIGTAAAASLAGLPPAEVRPLLAELCAASLLTEPQPGRFESHDLLRDYARDLSDVDDEALLRIVDHYLHSALRADKLLKFDRVRIGAEPPEPAAGVTPAVVTDNVAAMAWFTTERATARSTLEAAVAAGLDLRVWWLAWGMNSYYNRLWDKHDWLDCQRASLAAARRAGQPALLANSEYTLGYASHELGDVVSSRRHLTAALALYEQLGDLSGRAMVHLNLGIVARKEGDYAEALAQGAKAGELYRAAGSRVGEARSLNNIGWCYLTMGEYEKALDHCQRAAEIHESGGSLLGAAHTWDSVGKAHYHLGDIDQALECYQRSLDIFVSQCDRQYIAIILDHIGDAHQAAGNHKAAREAFVESLAILTDLEHPDAESVRAKLSVREFRARPIPGTRKAVVPQAADS